MTLVPVLQCRRRPLPPYSLAYAPARCTRPHARSRVVTENYTQMLACTYFAALDTPTLAAVTSSFFLAGRVAFAQGYYSGNAKNKDAGVFGYMLGAFPLYGLVNLFAAKQFGLM